MTKASDRPLHPTVEGEIEQGVFQHPIKGCVYDYDDRLYACVRDYGKDATEDDIAVYLGVEVHKGRCELGKWLTERFPDPKYRLINHHFVDQIRPIDFNDDESAETAATMKRLDMAVSVIEAGGACTICEAPNDGEGNVDHVVGCEFISWMLHVLAQQILDADGEPSLDDVVKAANDQIERMQ